MRYAGNYRLMDNPRAKHSHQLRAMMKRREKLAIQRALKGNTGKREEGAR